MAVGSRKHSTARTRYASTIVQPVHHDGEALLLARLQRMGQQLPVKGAIIPCSDDYVLFLSRYRDQLADHYEFVLPPEIIVEKLASKKHQYKFAEEVGVRTPQTFTELSDLREIAANARYPCVVKPTYPHLWMQHQQRTGVTTRRKLLVANSPEELLAYGPRIAETGLEWIVQEFVGGGDDRLYALYAYFDRDSKPLAVFVRQKLRQWPPLFGNGSYSVGVRNDTVTEIGIKLLQSIGYQGLTNTEFKQDINDGAYKLIEVNMRSAAQAGLAVDSGVDLPYIAYQDILRQSGEKVYTYREGVKWGDFLSDARAFLEYHRRGQLSWGNWLMSLFAARSHAFFAWDDPSPFFANVIHAISRMNRR
jgi:D-aspartate ligase